jgi:tetratricopeptide (TPR) repeat protein
MGRPRKNSLLFILALIAPSAALPQISNNLVSVTGIVLSEGSNERIQHVTVHLCDSGGNMLEEAITTDSGEFTFRNLKRVPYILTFDASGFQKYDMHLDLSFMSDRGMTVYLRPIEKEKTPAATGALISAHELSMPQKARNLMGTGKKKLYAEKKPQDGLKDFQQAISIAPDYYEVYCEIAMAYLTLGNTEEARVNFRKSMDVSHDSYGDADVGLGTLLIEKGETDAGEQAVRRGVQLNPASWMGFYQLGKLGLSRNQMAPALEAAERAKSLAPNAPVIYRLLANIHMQQQNYAALLEDIDTYVKLDPDSPAGVRAKQMREEISQKLDQQKKTASSSNP